MIKDRVKIENDFKNWCDLLINTTDNELNHVSENINKKI